MTDSNTPREDIAYEVRGTFRAFENALISALAESDISVGFFHILRLTWPEEGMTQKQIADHAFMTPSVASQQIQKMCKAGLLSRQTDPTDVRKKIVKLTEDGTVKRTEIITRILKIPKTSTENISDKDIQTTLKVLYELRKRLK